MASLPIDAVLDQIVECTRRKRVVIVEAQPGAGKTTRVPLTLQKKLGYPVVCTQPRRVAARMAAEQVARHSGKPLGQLVGYEHRFERKLSESTRLRFVTEGIARRQAHRFLREKVILIIDEIHERSLDADFLLAQAAHALDKNPNFHLVVMSATLESASLSQYLSGAVLVSSEGRNFPVELSYQEPRDREDLSIQVRRAIKSLMMEASDDGGDILVFLPGAGEISRCQEALKELATREQLLVCPLHSRLPFASQERALKPNAKRKVILATNIAETSLTIAGVSAVVDSGTARIARSSPWTGVPSLSVEAISQASAVQRMGRAGRTAKGRCMRLYSEHNFAGRRPYDSPEIERADLSSLLLDLYKADLNPSQLRWLTQPPAAAVDAAISLLQMLGALDAGGLSARGHSVQSLPLPPRLATLILAGRELGIPASSARAAALLSEDLHRKGSQRPASHTSDSDLIDALDEVFPRTKRRGYAKGANGRVQKLAQRLAGSHKDQEMSVEERDECLRKAILAGFADRVCRRDQGSRLVLASGRAIEQSASSAVLEADYLVALDVELRTSGTRRSERVLCASAIDPLWLLEMPGMSERDEHSYDRQSERVLRRRGIYYGSIAIDEDTIVDPNKLDPDLSRSILASTLVQQGLERWVDGALLSNFRLRYEFARSHSPDGEDWATLDDSWVANALLQSLPQATNLRALGGIDVQQGLYWALDAGARDALDKLAPSSVAIKGRKRVPVHYEEDRPPWIESRLQDFFGMDVGPTVARGKVHLVLHLQAPNRRAVQVTSDLAGFWERHYSAIRNELRRRYPKHAWPEDPMS